MSGIRLLWGCAALAAIVQVPVQPASARSKHPTGPPEGFFECIEDDLGTFEECCTFHGGSFQRTCVGLKRRRCSEECFFFGGDVIVPGPVYDEEYSAGSDVRFRGAVGEVVVDSELKTTSDLLELGQSESVFQLTTQLDFQLTIDNEPPIVCQESLGGSAATPGAAAEMVTQQAVDQIGAALSAEGVDAAGKELAGSFDKFVTPEQSDALYAVVAPGICEDAPAGAIFPGDGVNGPALSYQNNGDGTVTDLNTGLMWEVKEAGGAPGNCLGALHGVSATCTWVEATGVWIAAVNAEAFAGYTDWRIPNVRELHSLVHYGMSAPAIDPSFPGLTAFFPGYWSLTSSFDAPALAWNVNFSAGSVGVGGKDAFPINVRAVRGGP